MADYRRFTVDELEGVMVIRLVDPHLFDTLIVNDLEDELLDLLVQQAPGKLLVDFDNVVHCSTVVINSLLRAKKRLLANQGHLGLCGMSGAIRDAYRTLNLDGTVFIIYEDRERGLEAMSGLD